MLPSDHAAWILAISPAAYRKRLERARKRIRSFVGERCGIVNPAAQCRCARRVEAAVARGRLDPQRPVFVAGPTRDHVAEASRQMHELHDAAALLRSHPAYALPHTRCEAVLSLLRSGRFSMLAPEPETRGQQPH